MDTDAELLARARRLARGRGLSERLRFVETPAQEWSQAAERVICIGAAHAWGGTAEALTALGGLVRPGRRLLYGDGCWKQHPTEAAAAIFPEVEPLTQIVACVRAGGWRTLHLSTADLREWDDFESGWRRGREDWLRANPDAPEASGLRAEMDERLAEYVGVYRGVLGFCYLVLARPPLRSGC